MWMMLGGAIGIGSLVFVDGALSNSGIVPPYVDLL
jgi:hypothetical protein